VTICDTKMKHRKVSCDYHIVTKGVIDVTEMVMSQSHDRSSIRTMGGQSIATEIKYISSIENLMGTLLSSPC